jgi:hypothetical protein
VIGAVNPFEMPSVPVGVPPMPAPVQVPPMPIEPPKKRGGLPMGVVNRIQGMFSQGEGKSASPVKGTADNLALKPGWGGGT